MASRLGARQRRPEAGGSGGGGGGGKGSNGARRAPPHLGGDHVRRQQRLEQAHDHLVVHIGGCRKLARVGQLALSANCSQQLRLQGCRVRHWMPPPPLHCAGPSAGGAGGSLLRLIDLPASVRV